MRSLREEVREGRDAVAGLTVERSNGDSAAALVRM
jgi:hypothetical protein